MDLNLSGKVMIVTGGSSGIGEAIVREAAKEGAICVVADKNVERGNTLCQELEAQGSPAFFIQADLSVPEQCHEVVNKTIRHYQKIDILVNNAGGNDNLSLADTSPEVFMQSLQNHLLHYFALAHYALPYLKESKGNIVNISSKTAFTGQGGSSPYIAAKGAQLSLTRDWAAELLPFGIRVNAVIPAEVLTPMYEKWLQSFPDAEQKMQEIKQRIPLGQRLTTPEEIAYTVLFLASDKASHTTGQYLFPDGGYTHLDRSIGT